jgi:hypothetical protein
VSSLTLPVPPQRDAALAGQRGETRDYHLLVPLGSARIHSKVSAPSFDEKKAPHLGHRMTRPFDVRSVVHEHPKQNKHRIASKAKIITHLTIGTIPSFLSYSFFSIMLRICG